jgi:signal transduction histidine kinase
MIDSVRVRLALWFVLVLAILQVGFCTTVYFLLSHSIYTSVDTILGKVTQDVTAALGDQLNNDPDTFYVPARALQSLYHTGGAFAIYDLNGHLLADRPEGTAARLAPFPSDRSPSENLQLYTLTLGKSNQHRMSAQVVSFPDHGVSYVVVTSHMLDPMLSDVRVIRRIFNIAVPILLVLAGLSGWLLSRKSLAPVVEMAERARRIGADNDSERLRVYNRRDELGRLAIAFNELLDRLSNALSQQRLFMAEAAHELRTPISVIRTATEVTLDQEHTDETEYRAVLSIAAAQARHLSRTVEDVFRLARADMGHDNLRIANVYLDEVLGEAGRNAAILAQAKGISVVTLEMQESPFKGDEELLRQMVSNLLANSIKFTPRGGTISLGLEEHDGNYLISVEDSGVGIPSEAMDHIFDRFYSGRPAPIEDSDSTVIGTGLGLSIARWVAEAHHGTLRLLSTGEHGSTFVAELPVA